MNSSEAVWSIGLMTGTVLDGNIDIALLKTDGEKVVEFGPHVLAQYDASVNQLLSEALELAQQWQFNGAEPSQFSEAEAALTKAQALAIVEFIAQTDIPKESIASVGFHGQTVLHRAPTNEQKGQTRQLGDGQLMADILGIPVVYDFRSADVNAGGQGAPLAAVYHAALLANVGKKHSGKKNMGAAKPSLADRQLPHIQLDENLAKTAVLNLGGVANITWTDGKDNLVAFDTGPANAPINDFIQLHNEGSMDRGGKFAALGRVDEERLSELLRHPYLSAPYPKSLDRNDFGAAMAKGYSLTNGAALLTAFSASAVGKALDLLPQRPEQLIVCGGGRHNPTLMREIALRAQASVLSADDIGWHGDATEAECFAYLAVRHLRGLAFSYPGTTGVPVALCGGQLAQPSKQ